MAVLTEDFFAALPGEVYPQTFAKGSVCPEPLEVIARSLGIIEAPKVEKKMQTNAPENKMAKPVIENKMVKAKPETKKAK